MTCLVIRKGVGLCVCVGGGCLYVGLNSVQNVVMLCMNIYMRRAEQVLLD